MGRTPLLEVTLRAFVLGLAATLVAGCTWAALDLGPGAAPATALAQQAPARAASVARGTTAGRAAQADPKAGVLVTVVDGGWPFQFKTPLPTVLDLLRTSIYELGPFDRIEPSPDTALAAGMIIRVTRGAERLETVDENIPAGTTTQRDPDLFIGETRLVSPGRDGTVERTYRVRTEDGLAVQRTLVSESVVDQPVDARVAVGTHPLSLTTPVGEISYVRTINVLATYYTPANGGKAPGSPAYGITATGARATRGIVAVDPRVIPLYSWLYIPGYGIAQARDVGSAIIGDHIDVAFDDGDGSWWGRRYVTVYLLAP